MIRSLFPQSPIRWKDLTNPTVEELQQVQAEFYLHPAHIQDCLDPVHLPKDERNGDVHFIILRIFDVDSPPDADTVGSLTRKVALFIGNDFIVTVHRFDADRFQLLAERCILDIHAKDPDVQTVTMRFMNRALRTFQQFIERGEAKLTQYESELFSQVTNPNLIQEVHIIRRQLSITKRILIHTQDVIHQLNPSKKMQQIAYGDLKDTLNHLIFLTDELAEDAIHLLGLQMSISNQKTNEVIRVLTVFSVFFMPLTFIAGVYGMNFRYMPELEWPYGYTFSWGVMGLVTTLIAYWFYRRGWLQDLRFRK